MKKCSAYFPENPKEKEQEATRSTNELPEEGQEMQPREQPKLKYVPGPIGALFDQAEVVGLQLAINR